MKIVLLCATARARTLARCRHHPKHPLSKKFITAVRRHAAGGVMRLFKISGVLKLVKFKADHRRLDPEIIIVIEQARAHRVAGVDEFLDRRFQNLCRSVGHSCSLYARWQSRQESASGGGTNKKKTAVEGGVSAAKKDR